MIPILAEGMKFPLDYPGLSRIKKNLTVEVYDSIERETRIVKAYHVSGGYLVAPRQYGLRYLQRVGGEYEDAVSYGKEVSFPRSVKLYDNQKPWVEDILEEEANGYDAIAEAHTGSGKCLGRDTPIVMYDGRIKPVQDIKVGDLLMGPDSTPRKVLSTNVGSGPLYKVIPTKGDSFVCNDAHILSLKRTATKIDDVRKGEVLNIALTDYLSKSLRFKHIHKLWRVGVELPSKEVPVDPYIVGLYLGDGSRHSTCITIADTESEIFDYVERWVPKAGLSLRVEQGRGCVTVFPTSGKRGAYNWFRDFVFDNLLDSFNRKVIPDQYLLNSSQVRLQVLAGLMDSDGHLTGNCYEYVSKDRTLASDATRLARSLGLQATIREATKSCGDFIGTYYRVHISGDTSKVPCKVLHKKAKTRTQKKDHTVTGFSVEAIGTGEYYGFTISGDRLFLLGDFTVTHNTIMSLEVIRRLGRTALIVVDQEFLKQQWVERAVEFLGVDRTDIGVLQGDTQDYLGKKIVVAMIQSLYQVEYDPEVYQYFGTMVLDEVHVVGAAHFSSAMLQFNAAFRLGVSATPDRTDALQKILTLQFGPVSVKMKQKHKKSQVRYVRYLKPLSFYANVSPKTGRYLLELSTDSVRNDLLAEIIVRLRATGREVLAISDRIEQLENIMTLCRYKGLDPECMGRITGSYSVWGYAKNPTPARRPPGWERGTQYTPVSLQRINKKTPRGYNEKVKATKQVLFSTYSLFSKGVDVPTLSAGVDCTPRSKAKQVHGRILREIADKMSPIWVTIRDSESYKAEYQFSQRILEYLKSNAEIVEWNLEKGIRRVESKALLGTVFSHIKKLKAEMKSTKGGG